MDATSAFLFSIFFMTLGPLKVMPAFVAATRGTTPGFQRAVAIRAVLVASALLLLVTLVGADMVSTLGIRFQALQLAGGLVLLLSALRSLLLRPPSTPAAPQSQTRADIMRLAVSPLAVPAIVPPIGVAAVLTAFVLSANEQPGLHIEIYVLLAVMMLLDLLAMLCAHAIMGQPLVGVLLTLLSAIVTFVWVAEAIEVMMRALQGLGVPLG